MTYAQEVALVAIVAIAVTALLFALIHEFRQHVVKRRLVIPFVCMAWSVTAATVIVVTVLMQTSPAESLFTTKSWLSGGWHTGMNLFSIKINSWQRYLLVVIYQIVRSILGSLLINVFRSYLVVTVQSGKAQTENVYVVVLAQAAYNFFSYASALSDSFILMGQADMTLITMVVTVLADAMSTIYFMAEPKQEEATGLLPESKLPDRMHLH